METWIENKDYIESLFGPLEKKVGVNSFYINALIKSVREYNQKVVNLEYKVSELENENKKLKEYINKPFYKKLFKKF